MRGTDAGTHEVVAIHTIPDSAWRQSRSLLHNAVIERLLLFQRPDQPLIFAYRRPTGVAYDIEHRASASGRAVDCSLQTGEAIAFGAIPVGEILDFTVNAVNPRRQLRRDGSQAIRLMDNRVRRKISIYPAPWPPSHRAIPLSPQHLRLPDAVASGPEIRSVHAAEDDARIDAMDILLDELQQVQFDHAVPFEHLHPPRTQRLVTRIAIEGAAEILQGACKAKILLQGGEAFVAKTAILDARTMVFQAHVVVDPDEIRTGRRQCPVYRCDIAIAPHRVSGTEIAGGLTSVDSPEETSGI